MHHILVVGGNGFIGSAVCKAALARGMRVTSMSSSGRPFRTPKGHSPAWIERVEWRTGDALKATEDNSLFNGKTAVVHTIGILFESGGKAGYKQALKTNDPFGFVRSVGKGVSGALLGGRRNPLEEGGGEYERMNRDSALTVFSAFSDSSPPAPTDTEKAVPQKRSFIYLSAEDITRPFVPARYIETKRAVERQIAEEVKNKQDMRAVFVRPSLVYHSHFRPLTTPIATLMDLSATVHRKLPSYVPTPAGLFRGLAPSPSSSQDQPTPGALSPSSFSSMANALTVPAIHVDHVAEAIVRAIEDETIEGVMDVRRMREVIGWVDKGSGAESVKKDSTEVHSHDRG